MTVRNIEKLGLGWCEQVHPCSEVWKTLHNSLRDAYYCTYSMLISCTLRKSISVATVIPFPFPLLPLPSVSPSPSTRRRQAKVYFEPVSLREVMWEMRMSELGLKLSSNSGEQPAGQLTLALCPWVSTRQARKNSGRVGRIIDLWAKWLDLFIDREQPLMTSSKFFGIFDPLPLVHIWNWLILQ